MWLGFQLWPQYVCLEIFNLKVPLSAKLCTGLHHTTVLHGLNNSLQSRSTNGTCAILRHSVKMVGLFIWSAINLKRRLTSAPGTLRRVQNLAKVFRRQRDAYSESPVHRRSSLLLFSSLSVIRKKAQEKKQSSWSQLIYVRLICLTFSWLRKCWCTPRIIIRILKARKKQFGIAGVKFD